MIHRVGKSVPGTFQFFQKLLPFRSQSIILAGWSLRGLHPLVRQESVVLQAGQQRVKRAFHHNQPGLFQLLDNIGRLSRLPVQQQQNAILQHPLAHLRFYIVYIHFISFILYDTNIGFILILCIARYYNFKTFNKFMFR